MPQVNSDSRISCGSPREDPDARYTSEDLERVPNTARLIASGMNVGQPAHLYLIDTAHKSASQSRLPSGRSGREHAVGFSNYQAGRTARIFSLSGCIDNMLKVLETVQATAFAKRIPMPATA